VGSLQVVYSREDTLQIHQRSRTIFRQIHITNFASRTWIIATLGLLCVVGMFGANVAGVDAHHRAACTHSAQTFVNRAICNFDASGDNNASRANAQTLVDTYGMHSDATQSLADDTASAQNTYPYGQCTWWADQRYHQLHGVFVPWHTNANAWQWSARAGDYGWNVSSSPQVGDILVLQPFEQGAASTGHVGVVEQVLSDGHVVASSMNWGAYPGAVSNVQFTPGPGVSFVSA
jgi:surface antigen